VAFADTHDLSRHCWPLLGRASRSPLAPGSVAVRIACPPVYPGPTGERAARPDRRTRTRPSWGTGCHTDDLV